MIDKLPDQPAELITWDWTNYAPFAQDLTGRTLTAANLEPFLQDWSALLFSVTELFSRLNVAITINTADKTAEERFNHFIQETYPRVLETDQVLKQKLLASGLEPQGFAIPLRNMRAEADLFRQANLPLLSQERMFANEYDRIVGAQTVQWEGQELTVTQLKPIYQDTDRAKREAAWRAGMERQLADRPAINELWGKFMALRGQLAANAGKPDFRAYVWQQRLRFDYTPDDCRTFHRAIEEKVVPAVRRILEKRRKQLGVTQLRPWDLDVDPLNQPALRPFQSVEELKHKASGIFQRVDPQFGRYFDTLAAENLLDLDNRKNKAPGAYCTAYPVVKRPFVFANAVGIHDDVQTLFHESGHAFHAFEVFGLPYAQQQDPPMEFNEVASMSMELLASPYLPAEQGGFYTRREAARALTEHLEGCLIFWPYMAVVDAFQHWVYENHALATNPDACDRKWEELWVRYHPVTDWSGLEDYRITGWHRKLHIHQIPFYYIEYGLSQLGAVQIWRNALRDQAGAVASYRRALALGGTVTLPELYRTAGARLAFDATTLGEAVDLMESKIAELEMVK